MWTELPVANKEDYKRLILAFASLTEMFTQKASGETIPSPIVNSKFQETVFQRSFGASAEDIGNTSYDAAIILKKPNGQAIKYLVGIKTFGYASGDQKIAQFKANHDEWSSLIDKIKRNSILPNGKPKTIEEINQLNHDSYLKLAKRISVLRNKRIDSSIENLRGFNVSEQDIVSSIYHVLMTSKKGENPKIYVGETNYNKIDISNIIVLGCSSSKNPTNFSFTDGKHIYRYTAADSQLLMKFNNEKIVLDEWPVIYAENAYEIFADISQKIYGSQINQQKILPHKKTYITESYSWPLIIELYSGLNSFYGVGTKIGKSQRIPRINKLYLNYKNIIQEDLLCSIRDQLYSYLIEPAKSDNDRYDKISLRRKIMNSAKETKNEDFLNEIKKMVFRPLNEVYIPIPNSKNFHNNHPDFFGKNIGLFQDNSSKLLLKKEKRKFNLTFEPSGNTIEAYITQDNGKAIESVDKQSILGEWLLRKVFQLNEYEPVTYDKLKEIEINGIRLYKTNVSDDIHLEFIWIDGENPPEDLIPEAKKEMDSTKKCCQN